ncbi:hypothetical protein ACPFUL_002139 [Vibrio cholerae]
MDNNFSFFLFGVILFAPLFLFRCGFIKITILIYAYPIWIISGLWLDLPATRIISAVGYGYYYKEIGVAFLSSLLSYILFISSIYSIREKSFQFDSLKLSLLQKYIISIFFILFLIVAYPKAFFLSEQRFGLLGGVNVILISLLLISLRNSKLSAVFIFLIYLYMIIRGERVDFVLGLVALYFFYRKSSNIALIKLSVMLIILLCLGVFSGLKRSGVEFSFNDVISLTVNSITNFGTAIDVIHVYLSSVWYFEYIGSDIRPILNIFFSYIPVSSLRGAGSEFNYVWILREYIFNVGGGIFYSASMIWLGPIGVVFSGFIYGSIVKYLFLRNGINRIVFVAFFIMQFRIQWYGLTYFGSALFVMALFYFLWLFLLNGKIISIKRVYR